MQLNSRPGDAAKMHWSNCNSGWIIFRILSSEI